MSSNNLKIVKCNTFFTRLKGNMFKHNINNILCFKRCNSIHTFFMKEDIDVVMTNKKKIILYIFKNVHPNRIILPKKDVYYTYEFPANRTNNLKINAKIKEKE